MVFREQDKLTGYKPGMYTCIACSLLSIILVIVCDLDFRRLNRLADQGQKTLESHDVSVCTNGDNGVSFANLSQEDASTDFRYTY